MLKKLRGLRAVAVKRLLLGRVPLACLNVGIKSKSLAAGVKLFLFDKIDRIKASFFVRLL